MATIRKRNDRYQVQVRRDGMPAVSRTFSMHKDAERWARETEIALERGEAGTIKASSVTLGELLGRYMRDVSPTKKGYAAEARRLTRLIRDPISAYSLHRLTSEVLSRFRDRRMGDGVRAAQYDLILIRHCISVAVREWGLICPRNPVNGRLF